MEQVSGSLAGPYAVHGTFLMEGDRTARGGVQSLSIKTWVLCVCKQACKSKMVQMVLKEGYRGRVGLYD